MAELLNPRQILTVDVVRNIVRIKPKAEFVQVAQLTAEDARWVGNVSYFHRGLYGFRERRVRADLFAIGHDNEFTLDRGFEATFTFLDTPTKFVMHYSQRETREGLAYTMTRFIGKRIDRIFDYFVGSEYSFKEQREVPGPVTRNDIIVIHEDKFNLALNEGLTAGILKSAGDTR